MRELDDIGFVFDPFDIELTEMQLHFLELDYLKSYEWVNTDGEVYRMDKMRCKHLPYLMNIVQWMDKYDSELTPYKQTRQYKYARKRIVKLNKIVEVIRKTLSRPMGWSVNKGE